MRNILLKALILFIFICPSLSWAMGLQEGFPDWVRANCKQQGCSFSEDLLRSHPGHFQNFVKNMRFFRNVTALFDSVYAPHAQSLSSDTICCLPQDALTALMNHLFPCPDGELFIANQTGDPIGKLDPQRVGYMLRLLEDYEKSSDPEKEEIF